ncbi:hypothetical protein ASPZODRAFT_60730 [Penicilliopsis zonata CBS 506.65]|uniref:Zn(2)-C6 fungal-type domain-containing protein n=1 Tax=Penicilliopsis zonata CBS 506.65 TaxID=1073090 RepID=A0A1L9SNT3_9EURO|nr:hypothetical protein ASPZODRAFT_60730 [Penicilliopsis zonata CBS 506.65]OJJ48895.1 hypothetical protein ASPZODRAFT_60730 [Penicilliopsis zonata CBS 506.65]
MSATIRKRSRIACTSCQLRKRKCSGEQPCSNCAQSGSGCYYDFQSRKKKDVKANGKPGLAINPPPKRTNLQDDQGVDRISSVEANSGAAFVRKLGLTIDPTHAPRLHMFAWNVGPRGSPGSTCLGADATVVDIISQAEMVALSTVYFDRVDPCYSFIDRETLLHHVDKRWLSTSNAPDAYDAVLCGVAAFGFLFSRRSAPAAEHQLLEAARLILEQHLSDETPSVAVVTGWVLRAAYLRMTATPHIAWMASCSLMHLVEAAVLMQQSLGPNTNTDPEIRRRLFGMARHLNTWISFDLGRSRVVLQGSTTLPPTPRTGDYTTELFHLLPASESLDPTNTTTADGSGLEASLADVLDVVHAVAPLILAQCNLVLCIYRRLRVATPTISPGLLDRILTLAGKSLAAAREMAAVSNPWHQIANVPFQIVCTCLAIDSRASLALLGEAMRALHAVRDAYDTPVTREAYSTAYLLVRLHRHRREEDTRVLASVLENDPPTGLGVGIPASDPETHGLSDALWGEEWLDLQNFDLDEFLNFSM